jgi:uncharacterized membrane protein
MIESRRKIAGRLTWLSWAVLLLQQAIDSGLHAAPWFIWALKLVPLLLFLPGMRRDNLRSFIWLCFVCLGYFLVLVQRLFAQPGDILAWIGMVADVALFIAAMLYVRWRAQEMRVHP